MMFQSSGSHRGKFLTDLFQESSKEFGLEEIYIHHLARTMVFRRYNFNDYFMHRHIFYGQRELGIRVDLYLLGSAVSRATKQICKQIFDFIAVSSNVVVNL